MMTALGLAMMEEKRCAAVGDELTGDDPDMTETDGSGSAGAGGYLPSSPLLRSNGGGGDIISPPTSGGCHSVLSEGMPSLMDDEESGIMEEHYSGLRPIMSGDTDDHAMTMETGTNAAQNIQQHRIDFSHKFSSLILDSPCSGSSSPSRQRLFSSTSPALPLRRRASWAAGKKHSLAGGGNGDGADHCAHRLRSCVEDPVASQLLAQIGEEDRAAAAEIMNRAMMIMEASCATDAATAVSAPSSSVSSPGKRAAEAMDKQYTGGGEGKHLRQAPPSPSFVFSNSMPNLEAHFSPKTLAASLGGRTGGPQGSSDGTGSSPPKNESNNNDNNNMPPSPCPLIRQVSSSLLDVKNHEDISLLARPIPKRCCPNPFVAAGHSS